MPAVAVEYLQVALRVGEHDESGAECVDAVGLSIAKVFGQADAVPPAGKTLHGLAHVDLTNLVRACHRVTSSGPTAQHKFKHIRLIAVQFL